MKRSLSLACGFSVVMLAGSTLADGFRNPPSSASALGRSGGHLAHVDDASAARLNPARMVEQDTASVMGSLTLGYGRRTFDPMFGPSQRSRNPWSELPAVFAVVPLPEHDAAIGFSASVPFGRFTRYDRDVPFGQLSPYYSSLHVIEFNPTLALRLSERLSVAIGVSYYVSDLEFNYHPGVSFEADGDAFGANAALSWTPTARQTLALTYRRGFDIDYSGDVTIDQLPAEAVAMGASNLSRFRTQFRYPSILGLGYGLQLSETIRAELGVEWVEHSRNHSFRVDADNNNILFHPSPEPLTVPQNWRDNWTMGVGADWRFSPAWTLRAGYMYLESPSPSRTMIPVAAERDQSVLSTGLGFRHGVHAVDVAYAYGLMGSRRVQNHVSGAPGMPSPLDGEYDFSSHLLALSYAYRF